MEGRDTAATRELRALGPSLERAFVRLTDRVFVAAGYGMSTFAFVVGDTGVVAVDAGSTPEATAEAIAELRRHCDLPIAGIVYTHHHFDHIFGAVAVIDENPAVEIWAVEPFGNGDVAARLRRHGRPAAGAGAVRPPAAAGTARRQRLRLGAGDPLVPHRRTPRPARRADQEVQRLGDRPAGRRDPGGLAQTPARPTIRHSCGSRRSGWPSWATTCTARGPTCTPSGARATATCATGASPSTASAPCGPSTWCWATRCRSAAPPRSTRRSRSTAGACGTSTTPRSRG